MGGNLKGCPKKTNELIAEANQGREMMDEEKEKEMGVPSKDTVSKKERKVMATPVTL